MYPQCMIVGLLLLVRAFFCTTVDPRECPSVPPRLSRERPLCPGDFAGITPEQCMGLSADCCYDNTVSNVAWCYKPAMRQIQFKLQERTYVIETTKKNELRKSFAEAKTRCENDYRGSLVKIENQNDLTLINEKMAPLNVTDIWEVWLDGRTNVTKDSLIDLSNDDILESGESCIVLSSHKHPNATMVFNLYSKHCTEHTRWGSICSTDTIVRKDFFANFKKYSLEFGKHTSQAKSLFSCLRSYNATSLSKIKNDDILAVVSNELLQINNFNLTVWVDGKTDTNGLLDYEDIKDTGTNCVVLRQQNESSYGLYSESCSATNKALLCEENIVKPSKYIYGEAEDKCSPKMKITTSAILVHKDNCTGLGGKVVSSPTSENMVRCKLDWCGTNDTADITGIVAAVPGHCPGDSTAKGMIENIELCKRFYRGLTNKSVINNFKKSCSIEWCKKTKPGQWYSFTLSNDMCEVTHSLSAIPLYMNHVTCDELGGTRTTNPGGTQQCQMNFCHLGTNKECKLTSTGKEYKGTLSTTISGKQCQRWDSSYPHNHANTDPKMFPDNTMADASNYCRNPAGLIEGPFCYTTDAAVEWELCDIPFCPGKGPVVQDHQIGFNRYIYVPGKHKDPWGFCQKLYGSGGAIIETTSEIKELSMWLNELRTKYTSLNEIWIGGRAPASVRRGQEITDLQSIVKDGSTGHCLKLSNWNAATYKYDSNTFKVYAGNCPEFFNTFICETTEYEIENYQVDGAMPQMEVHDLQTCKLKCTGDCTAIGYNTYEDTCWHYFNSVDCKPGRQSWGYNFIVKQPCECHKNFIMMDDNVSLNASSVFQGTDNILENSPGRAKLNIREVSTPQGILLGAWVPADIDQLQWVEATFENTKLIYGVVTLGNSGIQPGMVTSYKVQYTSADDSNILTFVKDKNNNIIEFMGNLNADVKATNIFKQAVYTKVIRILPTKWKTTIALKFDVIGCNGGTNLALGKPTKLGGIATPGSPIVDGFSHSSFTWHSCSISQQLQNPWFSVDLQKIYLVEEVNIQTRHECCDGQLSQLSVRVAMSEKSHDLYSIRDECSFTAGVVEPGSRLSIKCQSRTGRYIIIQKKTGMDKLALCEVQVYGQKSPIQNIALNKPAKQINTMSQWKANLAVDGDMRDGGQNFAHTLQIKNPWWSVDLLESSIIYSVVIVTRRDCCGERFKYDLGIYVDDEDSTSGQNKESELCYRLPKSNYVKAAEMRNIQCKSPVEGRYVKIVLLAPLTYLTLVEVQVLGHKVFPRVYGGNTTAEKCVLPFIYNGTSHKDCITTKDRPRLWCATTSNYDKDFVWGFCMDVKLNGGRRENEGRVQVRGTSKNWGTVCDDDWDDAEANVVCRRLGYPAGGRAVFSPFFEQGSGSISLGNLKCNGSEASLFECSHEKNPTQCGHHEDAAVICTETDISSLSGYPNEKRSQQDNSAEGIVIIQSTQEVKVPGKITAWKFYSVKTGSVLKLQVWRRVYDLEGLRFMLIGQVIATDALSEDGPVTITSPVAINVESGDLLGFSFKNGNPISYDNTFYCEKHGKVKFSRNSNVTLGSIHSFAQKNDDDQKNCRMYSFFVEVETQKQAHLQEFTWNNKLYRIFTSKQKKASVEQLCKINMGDSASLFHMKTNSEFQYTKQKLGEIGITGTFMTGNTLEQALFVNSWAPCQPEEGKECVVISNENKDQEYLWYTRSCADQYYYICVKNVTANGTKSYVKSTPPSSKTTTNPYQQQTVSGHIAQIRGENNKHLALSIVLPIFFLILIVATVGIGLLYLRQRHTGKQIQDLLPAFTSRKRPLEIINPLYPDDDTDYYEHSGITTNPQTGTVEVDLKALGHDNQINVNKEFQKLGNI